MLLDPNQLQSVPPSQILSELALGRLDIDHRVLHALLDRRDETIPALVEFVRDEAVTDSTEIEAEAAQLFHALGAPEGIPFLIESVRRHLDEVPDEIIEALHFFGLQSIEPLLALYHDLDESESENVAFILATFHIRDERILELLLHRLDFNAAEGAFLLGLYGDDTARGYLEKLRDTLKPDDDELRKELNEALQLLAAQSSAVHEATPLDIYALYPKEADLPIDLFTEEERLELFSDPRAAIRAEAAHSFFNEQPSDEVVKKLLLLAQTDPDETVRARAWESLVDATDDTEVVNAMLAALRNPETPVVERAGVLLGLSLEMDRNEVRSALESLYQQHPQVRSKALEAMWRSLHPGFRDRFMPHLDDADVEVRRSAVWGAGYYGLKPALEKLRSLFDNEELRSDAIFAYSLAISTDVTKGRAKGLLKRIEKDAGGLSDIEERLAMTAIDERLMLSGKEPVFFPGD